MIFFCFLSFTYKAHCVLWQLKWTDLGSQLQSDHHCPAERACLHTRDPGLTIQAVSCSADTRSALSHAYAQVALPPACLVFQAGSSGLRTRPTPRETSQDIRQAGAAAAAPGVRAHVWSRQLGYIEIYSLLYCDNCTLIGTGLEMTRPAYRLHIVSHKDGPFCKICLESSDDVILSKMLSKVRVNHKVFKVYEMIAANYWILGYFDVWFGAQKKQWVKDLSKSWIFLSNQTLD